MSGPLTHLQALQPLERLIHFRLWLVGQDSNRPLVEGVVCLEPLALGQGLEHAGGLGVPVEDHRVRRLVGESVGLRAGGQRQGTCEVR